MIDNTHTTIKAQRATVKFCEDIEIDGYLLPDGEFRVGKASIAKALGYSKDWVRRVISGVALDENKKAETITQSAFSGVALTVEVPSPTNVGWVKADTLCLKDFRQLVKLAAKRGKPKAEAILDAIIDTGLEDWFRLSFGIEQLTLEEKRDRFYKSYAETINWLEQDKAEVKYLELPGDDSSHWNNATNLIVDYNWKGEAVYA